MPLHGLSQFYHHVFTFLDTNGDGSGVNNATGDYSGSPVEFYYSPGDGKIEVITRMIIAIGGDAVGKGGYGKKDMLVNGITVLATNTVPGSTIDVTGGVPIKAEKHWRRVCQDLTPAEEGFRTARWSFAESGIPLVLSDADRIVVTLNDDFTHLTEHRFMVQGSDASHGWKF